MGDVQEPQAGVGGAYTAGNNPRPGGKIDTGEQTPPNEGRTKRADQTESQTAQGDSVERQMTDTVSRGDAEIGQVKSPGGSNIDPETGKDGKPISKDEVSHRTPDDPYGVGTSASRPGESYADPATEHKGPTQRPVGSVEGDLMEPNNSASGTKDLDA
ncbi:MAG TPA: hypothetical protein VF244_09350 [Acidimicrobiales bacterium]